MFYFIGWFFGCAAGFLAAECPELVWAHRRVCCPAVKPWHGPVLSSPHTNKLLIWFSVLACFFRQGIFSDKFSLSIVCVGQAFTH